MEDKNNNIQTFYANGKLLLSAEYLVLQGALALAIPLNKGQSMHVKNVSSPYLTWKAYHPTGEWFTAVFDTSLKVINTNSPVLSEKLKSVLHTALKIADTSPGFVGGKEITTLLDFDPEWGWGSSSTLITNLANWLKINPWQLLAETFGGSGYDIACANAASPLFYKLMPNNTHKTLPVPFAPPFEDRLWVVYLNQKQNSAQAISQHVRDKVKEENLIETVSHISRKMANVSNPDDFMKLMIEHEKIVSRFTGLSTVKSNLFADFDGAIKSLGAWGGDFVLVLSHLSGNQTKKYFKTKGFPVLFKLKDVRLNN